jgi:hypothetical protein
VKQETHSAKEDTHSSEEEMLAHEQEVAGAVHAAIKAEDMRAAELLRIPSLDRERPARKSLLVGEVVVRGALWTFSAACVAFYVVLATWAYAQVEVPELLGLSEEEALTALADRGLQGSVAGLRSSDAPEGEVIEQIPDYGKVLEHDDVVGLILSSGQDGFEIPDVIGKEQAVALAQLERLGLQVAVEYLQVDAEAGTVLLITPIAGTRVRDTGDEHQARVTLYVAAPIVSAGLVDYQLNGLRVVIEPHYTSTVAGDVSFDVARRLSSLFEAANAETSITRTFRESQTEQEEFDARAAQFDPQLHIVLSIRSEGPSGIIVRSAEEDEASTARAIYERMQENHLEASIVRSDVFGQAGAHNSIEIVLGNTSDVEDVGNFTETLWRDHVARAIYMASAPQFSLDR